MFICKFIFLSLSYDLLFKILSILNNFGKIAFIVIIVRMLNFPYKILKALHWIIKSYIKHNHKYNSIF